jgi:hypothetical protein
MFDHVLRDGNAGTVIYDSYSTRRRCQSKEASQGAEQPGQIIFHRNDYTDVEWIYSRRAEDRVRVDLNGKCVVGGSDVCHKLPPASEKGDVVYSAQFSVLAVSTTLVLPK